MSIRKIRVFGLFLLAPYLIFAQELGESFVNKINSAGNGRVVILQDSSITARLGRSGVMGGSESSQYVEVNGYRIQVFAGNNQRVSKNEAYNKEADIKSIFPEFSTYVIFTAPFWRLRVGDFQSFQEAQQAMSALRAKFPAFGREMSLVKEKVRIKVQ